MRYFCLQTRQTLKRDGSSLLHNIFLQVGEISLTSSALIFILEWQQEVRCLSGLSADSIVEEKSYLRFLYLVFGLFNSLFLLAEEDKQGGVLQSGTVILPQKNFSEFPLLASAARKTLQFFEKLLKNFFKEHSDLRLSGQVRHWSPD